MSTILIADDNPDILTLVGETLRGAGHDVVQTVNPSRVTALLDQSTVDAAVLDVVMPISGLDLLKEIRAQPRWKNLPVLLLSGLGDTQDRVRGIREGADDYLAKPFEPAELVARVERLIARRDSEPGLSGNLEDFAPGDVTQNLAQGGKTGCLRVSSNGRLVEVYYVKGKIVHAETGKLRGEEAILALLSLQQGHFVFEASGEEEAVAKGNDPLELNSVLLEAAWLEDELKRRHPHLGEQDLLLRMVGPKPSDLDEELESLPLDEIYAHVVAHPETGVQELVELETTAPLKVFLTIAVLLEGGSFSSRERDPGSAPPSRAEKDPLGELLVTCRDRGMSKTVYLLILFQQGAWKDLLGLVKSIPASMLSGERQQLLDELIMRGSGTVRLAHDEGVVVLNLKPFRGDRLQGEALLSLAAGVVLWLDGKDIPDSLSQYVEKLEGAADRSRGILLSSETSHRASLEELIAGQRHWKVLTEPVKDISGLVLPLI